MAATSRKVAPSSEPKIKKPRRTKADIERDRLLADVQATRLRLVALGGLSKGTAGTRFTSPCGPFHVYLYMNGMRVEFEEGHESLAHRTHPFRINERGRWSVTFLNGDSVVALVEVLLNTPAAPRACDEPWPPENRAPLAPLDPKPAKSAKASEEPPVFYRVVFNPSYATSTARFGPPEDADSDGKSSDPEDAFSWRGPSCGYRRNSMDCDSNESAKAHAEVVAQRTGGVVEELYDEPSAPDHSPEQISDLLGALYDLAPGPNDPCPVCKRTGFHDYDCALRPVLAAYDRM